MIKNKKNIFITLASLSYILFSSSSHAVFLDYTDEETGRSITVTFGDVGGGKGRAAAMAEGTAKLLQDSDDISLDVTTWVQQAQNQKLSAITFFDVTDLNYHPHVKKVIQALRDRGLVKSDTTISMNGRDNRPFNPPAAAPVPVVGPVAAAPAAAVPAPAPAGGARAAPASAAPAKSQAAAAAPTPEKKDQDAGGGAGAADRAAYVAATAATVAALDRRDDNDTAIYNRAAGGGK